MKKSLIIFGIAPLLLGGCSLQPVSLWGNTFVLSGSYNNLDDKLQEGSTNRKDLTDNFSSIDWEKSTEISDHSSVDKVISEMDRLSKVSFEYYFKDFSLTLSKKEEAKGTVVIGTEASVYNVTSSDSDDMILDLKDSSGDVAYTVYHIKSANGKFERVNIGRGSGFSKIDFTFLYKQSIAGIDGVKVTYYANFLPK